MGGIVASKGYDEKNFENRLADKANAKLNAYGFPVGVILLENHLDDGRDRKDRWG